MELEGRELECRLCGRMFVGRVGALYCPECRHNVPCAVCGKILDPKPTQFTRYVQRGFLTCGRESCRQGIMKRNRESKLQKD